MSSPFRFELERADASSRGRSGRWLTPHGVVDTPAFMPVGTAATVKGLTPDQLREAGVQMVLANTYHLALRPGADVVADLGGLHGMMDWDGPILTDSGGFQVFSLARLTRLDDDKVVFRSHIDGRLLELSPERAVQIQEQLGADCIMCLDECPPHDVERERLIAAVDRTTRWAARCQAAQTRPDQALFGIVQGGTDPELRERSAQGLLPLGFPAYAIGGLSVGEEPSAMYATLDFTVPLLPADRPRYLMGVGKPIDLVEAVARGVDMFDCVLPTRSGRHGQAWTWEGSINLKTAAFADDETPLDADSDCPASRDYSRAYLHHLVKAEEILGQVLLSWHNIAFFQALTAAMRSAIAEGRFAAFRSDFHARQRVREKA